MAQPLAIPRPSQPGWPLEVGLAQPLQIREEWLARRADACRLLYVSDIHLRKERSTLLCRQVLDAARVSTPHVVLLGGDLVDQRSELSKLTSLVRELQQIAPVLAIGGNHDRWVGIERVRRAVEDGHGKWIHSSVARVPHGGRTVAIAGPEAPAYTGGDVRVVCAHDPRIWKACRDAGHDLVLAGHLHGCQLVGWEYRDRLFPGAFLYPYCFLSHHHNSTQLVVSRGVSDLLPIRWRCPREVVLCHV